MNVLLKNNIYWVGVIDWNVRDFHGYQTDRGSTYKQLAQEALKRART